jgi:uncharacterized protein involved in exopolysaccharide biosynthesis
MPEDSSVKANSWNLLVVFGLLSAAMFTSLAVGQNRTFQEKIEQMSDDNIPEAVLQTEKGQYLAQRLRILRRQEESMGSKHPELKSVQNKIAEVKQQLDAWTSVVLKTAVTGRRPLPEAILEMNDTELRKLVQYMYGNMQYLERRVESLEKRLEVY